MEDAEDAGLILNAFSGDNPDEEGGFFEEMANAIGKDDAQGQLNTAFDNLKNTPKIGNYFKEANIYYDNGNVYMTIGDEKVDMNEIRELMGKPNGDNIQLALEKLGFPRDSFERLGNWKETKAKFDTAYEQTYIGRIEADFAANKEWVENSKLDPFRENPPENEEQLEQLFEKNGWDYDGLKKDYKDVRGENPDINDESFKERLKKWLYEKLKSPLTYINLLVRAALVVAFKELVDFINGLAHAASGCWADGPNSSCKIATMTCNSKDLSDASKYQICEPCQDTLCKTCNEGVSSCDWVPITINNSCSCDPTGKSLFPGKFCPAATDMVSTCQLQNPKCPIQTAIENYTPITTCDTVACPNASNCVTYKDSCASGGDCDDFKCSNNNMFFRTGQTIQCKSCNFLCALGHLLGNILKWPEEGLEKLIKMLVYIVVGVVALLVIWMILKQGIHWVSSGGKSSGGNRGGAAV
jgi:hypothetical protein